MRRPSKRRYPRHNLLQRPTSLRLPPHEYRSVTVPTQVRMPAQGVPVRIPRWRLVDECALPLRDHRGNAGDRIPVHRPTQRRDCAESSCRCRRTMIPTTSPGMTTSSVEGTVGLYEINPVRRAITLTPNVTERAALAPVLWQPRDCTRPTAEIARASGRALPKSASGTRSARGSDSSPSSSSMDDPRADAASASESMSATSIPRAIMRIVRAATSTA
jgi:hypothetical protein